MMSSNEEEIAFTEEIVGPHHFWLKIAEDDFNTDKKTLFATMIWQGARALSSHLAVNAKDKIVGKSVIEFGAGAGLPSFTCYKIGASVITSSDYPAPSVISNLLENVQRNVDVVTVLTYPNMAKLSSGNDPSSSIKCSKFSVIEHVWGTDVTSLLLPLNGYQYDVVIAAECLWKSDTHESFIASINNVLKPGGTVFLSFSHHIPGLEHQDLSFFEIIKNNGFSVTDVREVIVPHMWSNKSAVLYVYELFKSM